MTTPAEYFWPGTTVLINKLGIRPADELAAAEYVLTTAAERDIRAGIIDIPRTFDGAHLDAIHRELFGEIYEWAGQHRGVNMSKGGLEFADVTRIDSYLADTAHIIAGTNWPHLERAAFVEEAARVYSYVNTAHPYREGNGRASKLFLAQLAEQTRFDFDFETVHPDVWNQRSMLTRPDLGQYLPHHREMLPVFDHITIDRPHAPTAGTEEHDRDEHLSLTPEPLTYEQHPEPISYTQHPEHETRYRGYGGPESPGHHRGMSR